MGFLIHLFIYSSRYLVTIFVHVWQLVMPVESSHKYYKIQSNYSIPSLNEALSSTALTTRC